MLGYIAGPRLGRLQYYHPKSPPEPRTPYVGFRGSGFRGLGLCGFSAQGLEESSQRAILIICTAQLQDVCVGQDPGAAFRAYRV